MADFSTSIDSEAPREGVLADLVTA